MDKLARVVNITISDSARVAARAADEPVAIDIEDPRQSYGHSADRVHEMLLERPLANLDPSALYDLVSSILGGVWEAVCSSAAEGAQSARNMVGLGRVADPQK